MPRLDLETLDVNDLGSINLADLRVTGQRSSDKHSEMNHEKSRWRQILRDINKDLIMTADRLLVDKDNHREELLQQARRVIERKSFTSQEKAEAYSRIEAELFGFGIIDKYMRNNQITEIIIDAPEKIDVEVGGVLYRVGEDAPFEKDEVFNDDEELQQWTDLLLKMAKAERPLNYGNPVVNMELANGERVQATCAPVTEHITINIRKSVKQTKQYTSDDLVSLDTANKEMMDFLLAAARGKATILVIGPTGSGKTTVVRILLEKGIAPGERVLMIEETRETNANIKRFLSLQTVKQGQNKITAGDLHEVCMRKRPNRVLVSEILGADETDAYLMTTASGHPGGITSMHANDSSDAVFLLVMRMQEAGYTMSEAFLERFVHNQLHIMVFNDILTDDGRRKMTSIVEVNSLDKPNVPKFKDIFLWDPETDTFEWVNDVEPDKRRKWRINGADVPVFTGKGGETSVIAG